MINFKLILRSIHFAFNGLVYVVKTQNNARFHLLATILVIVIGVLLRLSFYDWCFISIAIGLVWATECFNTSIEKIFDLINPEFHLVVKNGKDSSAAAVLISSITSAFIGLFIFIPKLIELLK